MQDLLLIVFIRIVIAGLLTVGTEFYTFRSVFAPRSVFAVPFLTLLSNKLI